MRLVAFERTRVVRASASRRTRLHETHPGVEELDEAPAGGIRCGAELSDDADALVDLNRAAALELALAGSGSPEAVADSVLPPAPLALLGAGAEALAGARRVLDLVASLRTRHGDADLVALGVLEPRGGVHIAAPVPRPGKLLGVARNYPAHAAESGGSPPEEPVFFVKASSSVIGPGEDIVLPAVSEQVDYEGELAVVIGGHARRVEPADALGHVAGYAIGNDVSARDFQGVRGQHFVGKSADTFCPLGPALLTADEVPDPQDLGLRTLLSGEVVQDARTKEMTFPIAELIAFASRLMTLEPGDVLLTGTPAGVGRSRVPPRYLREGDVLEVEIERLGRLRNPVRADRT